MVGYAEGRVALEQKDFEAAAREADALDANSWGLHADTDKDEDKPDQVLRLLQTVSLDLRGNLRSAQGKHDEAIELLEKAVEQEKEVGYGEPPQYRRAGIQSPGYAYIPAGKWEQARHAFPAEMVSRP